MRAGLIEREDLSTETKEGDSFFPDVDGHSAALWNVVDCGYAAERHSSISAAGPHPRGLGVSGASRRSRGGSKGRPLGKV